MNAPAFPPDMTGDRHPDNDRFPDLSSDDVFDVLVDQRRRTVLFHLRQHGAATVDELVDVLVEVGGPETDDRVQVLTSLVHVHVPKLSQAGLVSYDTSEQIVESVAAHDDIGDWLDLAVRREIALDLPADTDDETAGDSIRVLLTDDEPGLPEMIASYVEGEHPDISVTTATSALEAVTRLEETPFDCLVSDYQMPAISGLDFLQAVRERDATIPFIVFTAKGSEEIASEAIATGVTDYVQKGPNTDQYDRLIDRIRRAVDQRVADD